MKKLVLFAIVLLSHFAAIRLVAQTYPYWDAANPGYPFRTLGPMVASTNAVFAVGDFGTLYSPNFKIIRWTACGGWEALPGLTIDSWECGFDRATGMMTVHGNYLYAVGLFHLDGYTNSVNHSDLAEIRKNAIRDGLFSTNEVQIARFDFNTGHWSAIGQDFTATNVFMPSTIAVDSSNRIYVGFDITPSGRYLEESETYESLPFGGATLDMLDVSTNEGASWQRVGGGLTMGESFYPDGLSIGAIVSALCADGTNLYIGGNFVQTAGALVSSNVIMWTGNDWRALAGISRNTAIGGWDFGINIIDSIACIGTNIYVAGAFDSPQIGLARFSNVTGESLPVADPATYLGWDHADPVFGLNLAVNNNQLYLAGFGVGVYNLPTNVACLMNPQDPYPADWRNLSGGTISVGNGAVLATTPNGNAVYVMGGVGGQDDSGNYSDGFSRWLVGPDVSSSDATITNVTWMTGYSSLSITGTPGSHWQVMASTDLTSWNNAGSVTLWGGTNTFIDNVSYETQPYYYLTNNCGHSSIAPCSDDYTLCVTNDWQDELEVVVYDWDNGYAILLDDYVSAYGTNCFGFSVPPGHQLRCQFFDWAILSGEEESFWFIPARQKGAANISGGDPGKSFNPPTYSESGGPLCQ